MPTRTARAVLLGILVASSLCSEIAEAQTPRNVVSARQLYRRGRQLYGEGAYEAAAQAFAKSYELDPKPGFLLNAAQAYRQAVLPAEALRFYRKFLQVAPRSPLRPQVVELVREVEQDLARPQRTPHVKPRRNLVRTGPPHPADPPPPPSSPSIQLHKRWWFWTLAAIAVSGLVAGVGAGVASQRPAYVQRGSLGELRF